MLHNIYDKTILKDIGRGVVFGLAAIMLSVSFPLSSLAAPRVQPMKGEHFVIVIDPGHGGKNEGTIENGFLEKSMTLTTAQAMYDELIQYDNVEVYLTRTRDEDMTLEERAQFAADVNADFLFSIHYNASLEHDLFGSEVWISASAPYNAYGYQFGYQQMLTMRDMGLYLRGVKTRLGDKGDYYGIIREAVSRDIPAVIIEHCHVDEERDYPFCDTAEDQIAFGKADALSVAKYLGLSSSLLGVDYSEYATKLPEVTANTIVAATLKDETPPDVCQLELLDTDYENGVVTLQLSAADYDSPLIYYQYSYDGGLTYSPLQPWPDSDVLQNTYTDTFSFTIQIPSGTVPNLCVRAYNLFDHFTESNAIAMLSALGNGEDAPLGTEETGQGNSPDSKESTDHNESSDASLEEEKLPGTTTFMPAVSEEVVTKEVSFLFFLKICVVIAVFILVLVLISQFVLYHRRRKRRRQQRKLSGNNRNHAR